MENQKPGPTKKYPEGKIHKDDSGELKIAVGPITDPLTKEAKLLLQFGTSVSWIAMTADQAIEFAKMIRKKAKKIIQQRSTH